MNVVYKELIDTASARPNGYMYVYEASNGFFILQIRGGKNGTLSVDMLLK